MNNKYNKQLLVNDIFGEDHKYEWQAIIEKYSTLRKWITVGESITSNEFCLIFPNSIGESKWKLSFYPNGQYVDENASSHVGIYLILLSCENKDTPLIANVTFRLKPANDFQHGGYTACLNTEFVYSHPKKRWVGKPDFVGKNYLSSKRSRHFFDNDTLAIQCTIEVAQLRDDHIKNGSNVNNVEKNNRNVLREELMCSDDDFESKHHGWTQVNSNKKTGNQVMKQYSNNNAPNNSAQLRDDPIKNESNVSSVEKKNGNVRKEKRPYSAVEFNRKNPEWTQVNSNKKKGNQGMKQNSNNNAPKPKSSVIIQENEKINLIKEEKRRNKLEKLRDFVKSCFV